ncbi:MAG TPA: FAD-dependent thymidylate synthase [Chloroflexota bacterium]|nr:FAD-dependent thymidylate synthase [Chloroflexota bacterium]
MAVSDFSAHERELLGPYFTNLDRQVFALRNLPEVVKGALFSRYSRSGASLRRTFLDEFVGNPDLMLSPAGDEGLIATDKAEAFYDRVLVGYGDDSVAELGGAHVALEGISALAAKEIEDSRIGLSPLEKSTRYVFFDRQVDGQFEYVRPHDLMHSPLAEIYSRAMDACFQAYAESIAPLSEDLRAAYPRDEGTSERAYRQAIRAKAADILRSLLPVGHLTNMGLFGNGRAFEYLLIKMAASRLAEVRELGYQLGRELCQVIPSFTKRAGSERGRDHSSYLRQREMAVEALVGGWLPSETSQGAMPAVRIVDWDAQAEAKVLAALLYPHTSLALAELRRVVAEAPPDRRRELLQTHVAGRGSRHRRPGRAFEMADYTVEFCANFGVYKDLQRHRMSTQQRQDLSTQLGWTMPPELTHSPLRGRYEQSMEVAAAAWRALSERFPAEAQYVVPTGYRMRWTMKLNLRELCHMVELRSTVQGHPDYRAVVHELTRQVRAIHPLLAELATEFVDWSEVDLARLESEKRTDAKATALGLQL